MKDVKDGAWELITVPDDTNGRTTRISPVASGLEGPTSPFNGRVMTGPSNIPAGSVEALDFFRCLLNQDFIRKFIFSTNAYATKVKLSHWPPFACAFFLKIHVYCHLYRCQ